MKERMHFDETLTKREFGYSNIWSSGSSWQKPEIGVIGAAGELGRKLSFQIDQHLPGLVAFDQARRSLTNQREGIDPQLNGTLSEGNGARWSKSIEDLVGSCSMVHLCAPLDSLLDIKIEDGTMLVLHDGVMSSSHEAADNLRRTGKALGPIAVVHCLMNQERVVNISERSDDVDKISKHIEAIGLVPKVTSIKEHDQRMARTQGILCTLKMAFQGQLSEYAEAGLLTPSGSRMLALIKHLELKWTAATEKSALRNPENLVVIAKMIREISKSSGIPIDILMLRMTEITEGFNDDV